MVNNSVSNVVIPFTRRTFNAYPPCSTVWTFVGILNSRKVKIVFDISISLIFRETMSRVYIYIYVSHRFLYPWAYIIRIRVLDKFPVLSFSSDDLNFVPFSLSFSRTYLYRIWFFENPIRTGQIANVRFTRVHADYILKR